MAVAVVALALVCASSIPAVAQEPRTGGLDLAASALAWLTTHANGILATAYERAPVLVTVLAALLILPVTALAALLTQSLRLKAARANRTLREAAIQAAPAPSPPPPAQPVAWLTAPTGERLALPPALQLVRIGRHDDNDIRLGISTVHRHHAIIHRTPAADFVITDVSGAGGNGIKVNGRKLTETRLLPGDKIQLGEALLEFESALPAYINGDLPRTHEPHTLRG